MRRPYLAILLLLLLVGAALAQPDARYWRLDDINAQLAQWADTYPDLIHVTSLGQSGLGEEIPLVCISDNAAEREVEPGLFLHAAQHANECNGTTALMVLMEKLLTGYGSDPAITARVDELELWLAPVVNVDGHRYVFSGAPSWQDWRKTLRDNNENGEIDFPDDGVDLNRNYDWRWPQCTEWNPSSQYFKGPSPFSESESRAIRDFVLLERPLLVGDLHSPVTIAYDDYLFYPWISGDGAPDLAVAGSLAGEWADATRNRHGQQYHDIQCYDTLPKEQCWIYGEAGILTLLMEIEDQCWFAGATVDTVGHRVARGTMALLDRALEGPGIKGTVTDALTGAPLAATVIITEMNSSNVGPRLCDQANGQYHRFTMPGSYTLRVSFRDYEGQIIPVTVGDDWTKVDVELMPVMTDVADGSVFRLQAPNPARRGQALNLHLAADSPPAMVGLYDLRGRRVARLGAGLAAGVEHRLSLPGDLADGTYLVRVHLGSRVLTRRLTYIH